MFITFSCHGHVDPCYSYMIFGYFFFVAGWYFPRHLLRETHGGMLGNGTVADRLKIRTDGADKKDAVKMS